LAEQHFISVLNEKILTKKRYPSQGFLFPKTTTTDREIGKKCIVGQMRERYK
jgi:hypothetical protein